MPDTQSSTIMSEQPPFAAGIPDPTKPYTPSPDVNAGLPPVTPPPSSSITQEKQPDVGPRVLPGSRGAKAASIAFGLDAVLRGAMKGRDDANQKRAYQANRLMQGFQQMYKSAGDQYIGMLQNNPELAEKMYKLSTTKDPAEAKQLAADPDVTKAQDLLNQSNSARAVVYKIYNGTFAPKKSSKGGKGKSKGGDQSGDESNPIMMAQSKDPVEKLQGMMAIGAKVGNPYALQGQYLMSPEYREQVKQRQQQQAITGSGQTLEKDVQQSKIKWQQYMNMDPAKMTDDQKAEFKRLSENPLVNPMAAKQDRKISSYPGADKKEHIIWQRPDMTTYETVSETERQQPVSATRPIRAWRKDEKGRIESVEVDPQTNQVIPGTENRDLMPPSSMMDSIKTGEFSYKDPDGKLHRALTTTVTSHVPHGSGGGTGGGGGTGAGAGTNAGAGSTGTPKGDRVITDAVPSGQTKSRADAADTVLQLIPKVKAMISDPETRKELGALPGRVSEAEMSIGNASPKVRELYGTLKSIYSMAGTMHGWRSLKVAQEFEKAYGGLHTNPDALLAGMDAMAMSAEAMYETGYKHPYGQKLGPTGADGKQSTTTDPNDPLKLR